VILRGIVRERELLARAERTAAQRFHARPKTGHQALMGAAWVESPDWSIAVIGEMYGHLVGTIAQKAVDGAATQSAHRSGC
jgi:hypothetical protein